MIRKLTCVIMTTLLLFSVSPSINAADLSCTQAADALHTLGLFNGTGSNVDGSPNFDLDRAPTREEAITMLVRLLGKGNEATAGNWSTPFTDVDSWAAPYVGYAYSCHLTSGTSSTSFGGKDTVTAAQYITFVLRALGYNSSSDFTWNSAWSLSDELAFTHGEYSATSKFTRGDVAQISYNALKVPAKNSSQTLLASLVANGTVSSIQVSNAGLTSALTASAGAAQTELTAEQISAQCSSAVFCIETYLSVADYPDTPYAGGSGFFITSDGVAVTNYHVLENSSYAVATTTSGNTYQITNVLYANKDRDIAVIRVSKTALSGKTAATFNYLSMLGSTYVSNGAVCYAIGSPLGLQNTITNGIISNNARVLDDGESYIQTSAAISQGSSGGALINPYGQVIGVTCGAFTQGANLTLAVPLDSILSLDFTVAGSPYADTFGVTSSAADTYVNVYASPSNVTLTVGESKTIYITVDTNYEEEFYLDYVVSDDSYLNCSWGDQNGDTVELTITGLKVGSVKMLVASSISEDISECAFINVTIK